MRILKAKTACLLILAVVFLTAAVPSRAGWDSSLFNQAEDMRAALEKDKKAQDLRHKWLNVIEAYEAVASKHPKSPYAPRALLAVGDLCVGLFNRSRRTSDLDQAIDVYRRLAKTWPESQSAARAQLAIGQIYYHNKKDPDRAYVELLKVELNHPQAKKEAADARKLMSGITGKPEYAEATAPEEPKPKTPAGDMARVKGLRHWHNPTYSRIAIDLDREVKFQDHLLRSDPDLKKPMRLYLDLREAKVDSGVKEEMLIGDGLLKRARVGQYDQRTVRVVLDIQNIYNYRIFSLTNPFRIVVDVTGDQNPDAPVKTAKADAPAAGPEKPQKKDPLTDLRDTAMKRPKKPRGPAQTKTDAASLARQLGLGIHKVVIDPGHGGKDRGATGITGLREKDLTLKVSEILADKIKKRLKLEVVLTRNGDRFLTLEERMAKANTEAADLFVSIHANAHKDKNVHGFETYILNIATDKEAIRVATRENAASSKSMSDLQVILSDLMLNAKIAESGSLGTRVHKATVRRLKKKYKNVKDLGVKQAPFYVLIGANMPSILVEMGFISNKTEESRLNNAKYIDHLTDGIVDGIKAYQDSIKTNP